MIASFQIQFVAPTTLRYMVQAKWPRRDIKTHK